MGETQSKKEAPKKTAPPKPKETTVEPPKDSPYESFLPYPCED